MRVARTQANWGPAISTPGISIALVEKGRTKTPTGTQIMYEITGSGFGPDERLSLIRWPLNSPTQAVMGNLAFDNKGVAVCAPPAAGSQPTPMPSAGGSGSGTPPAKPQGGPSCDAGMKANQPVEIETSAAAGEAIRVALVDEVNRRGAAASAVPFPIASEDKGCRLQVVLGTRDASLVLVEGNGFPASAEVKLDSVTDGETPHPLNSRTNADGHLVFAILPNDNGKPAGDTTVRYDGVNQTAAAASPTGAPAASPRCAPTVTFHWGTGTYKAE